MGNDAEELERAVARIGEALSALSSTVTVIANQVSAARDDIYRIAQRIREQEAKG